MKDIREVAKLLHVPGASKCRSIDTTFMWEKERGYADRQMAEMCAEVRVNGWTLAEKKPSNSPDGNVIASGNTYVSPDGVWALTLYSKYGVTSSENRFAAMVFRMKDSQ